MLHQYLARQLSKPSGMIGRLVLGRLWNRRNAALNETTLAQLDLQAGDRILEIGFGGGYLLARMLAQAPQGYTSGIDASLAMVANARKRFQAAIQAGRLEIQSGFAEELPYSQGYFTKACSVNSIFYWKDARQGAAEAYRVLEAGGRFVLTYTCKKDLEQKGFVQHGVRTYEEDEIRQLLAEAGFRDIKASRARDRHREFMCICGRK